MNRSDYEKQLRLWINGVIDETAYWRHWFKHGVESKDNWEINYKQRLEVHEFSHKALEFIEKTNFNDFVVMDIGSGPITRYGNVLNGKKIKLIPIDPLANEYEKLCTEYKVIPLTKTIMGFGEYLTSYSESESADIIIYNNSLDHSIDPIKCISSAIDVLKIGGVLSLYHKRCEAENENYIGMHQWNIDEKDGRLVIWNNAKSIDVGEKFGSASNLKIKVITDSDGIDYIEVNIVKKSPYFEKIEEIKEDRKIVLEQLFSTIALYNSSRNFKIFLSNFRYARIRVATLKFLAFILPKPIKTLIKRLAGRLISCFN